MNSRNHIRIKWVIMIGIVFLFFPGCVAMKSKSYTPGPRPVLSGLYSEISSEKLFSDSLRFAASGVKLLSEGLLEKASAEFNKSLKLDPANSYVHFLNGLVYHLRALHYDASMFELGKQGYELSIKFDPTNWIARYYLGLLHLDRREFAASCKRISETILYNDSDPDILYSLVVASYYANDPVTAAAALFRLRKFEPDSRRVLRVSPVVMASLGCPEDAGKYLTQYQDAIKDASDTDFIAKRIRDWNYVYGFSDKETVSNEAMTTKKTLDDSDENRSENLFPVYNWNDKNPGEINIFKEAGVALQNKPGNISENKEPVDKENNQEMVIVDIVIIRTEENISERKGVNLLNGLSLQFGGSTGPAYSDVRTDNDIWGNNPGEHVGRTVSRAITKIITIPAITYSLNIFNSNAERNEILARPTLVAHDGKESTFFTGRELKVAAGGGAYGRPIEVEKDIGVKLTITPQFRKDGQINIDVYAERTFLQPPSEDVIFTFKMETSKTFVHANVVMNFGETLILSGLSEKETSSKRDGVPLLQDIPIIQYLFSRKETVAFQKSVLILVTPRKPQFVYYKTGKDKEEPENNESIKERSLSELQARYSDWFKPYPNWASVFHHMQSNSLYREFRTGDVSLERWEQQETVIDRLKKALEFLFY